AAMCDVTGFPTKERTVLGQVKADVGDLHDRRFQRSLWIALSEAHVGVPIQITDWGVLRISSWPRFRGDCMYRATEVHRQHQWIALSTIRPHGKEIVKPAN